jgi:hypothetical protein
MVFPPAHATAANVCGARRLNAYYLDRVSIVSIIELGNSQRVRSGEKPGIFLRTHRYSRVEGHIQHCGQVFLPSRAYRAWWAPLSARIKCRVGLNFEPVF